MITSRRNLIKYVTAAPVAIGAMTAVFAVFSDKAPANVTPGAQLGSITGSDPAGYLQFAQWFGRKPDLALLAFNQTSPAALSNSISYGCRQGAQIMAAGAKILWSIPCPGGRQLEAIAAGSHDALYTTLFRSILDVSPKDNTSILVRLPWEFNLSIQENAAIDESGKLNPAAFIAAWQHLAAIAKAVSPRMVRIWCPGVTTMSLDPATCWPGAEYVEIISQDFYMQTAYFKAGDFSYFLKEARGLQWGADFAATNRKFYGLSEWGMNSDIFVGDLKSAAAWLSGLGSLLHHHCWWDLSAVTDCTLSNGTHPGLAAAYKAEFS